MRYCRAREMERALREEKRDRQTKKRQVEGVSSRDKIKVQCV